MNIGNLRMQCARELRSFDIEEHSKHRERSSFEKSFFAKYPTANRWQFLRAWSTKLSGLVGDPPQTVERFRENERVENADLNREGACCV